MFRSYGKFRFLKSVTRMYCEKPIAGSHVDAVAMLKTAKSVGRKLAIQLSTLYNNETKAARVLIREGHLGRIYHARSTGYRRQGRPFVDGYGTSSFVKKEVAAGGALYDMGVYRIAQILHLMDNPDVLRISGKTYQETPLDAKRSQSSGYNVEELGLGFIRLQGNVTLDIIESWAVYMDAFESSSIFGSKGGIRLKPFGFFHMLGEMQVDSKIDLDAALQGRVELLPTAEIALNTMLISEGIYLSEKLGREVSAAEVLENSVSTAVKL